MRFQNKKIKVCVRIFCMKNKNLSFKFSRKIFKNRL